ncbi:hypothetical protein RF11_07191 [Thelohanellus kitauei]|uniref:Uncharacterized protein n=1 Tax=Thelohanellus kitauei TaxID=669202 RepID=A0A0C2IAS2_THEKT|nr:hypothetical protein RF11_07191 [Thelohanellus kitauei]
MDLVACIKLFNDHCTHVKLLNWMKRMNRQFMFVSIWMFMIIDGMASETEDEDESPFFHLTNLKSPYHQNLLQEFLNQLPEREIYYRAQETLFFSVIESVIDNIKPAEEDYFTLACYFGRLTGIVNKIAIPIFGIKIFVN